MENRIKRPEKLTVPNMELLYKTMEEYFDHMEDEDTCEDTASDMDHLLKENLIEALYGKQGEDFICQCHDDIENKD